MNENNVAEILEVLEKIRATEFPDVPPSVVREILQVQFERGDDRVSARTKTQEVVNRFLQSVEQ